MEEAEIRRLAGTIATTRDEAEADEAWGQVRPLGAEVVPYLAAAYPEAGRYQGRVRLVFHSIKFARSSDAAFDLGVAATDDRATLVRYRACGLLAYSLRRDAIPVLEKALQHPDPATVDDARFAIRAIKARNHHLFVDRTGSGRTHWVVNPGDDPINADAGDRMSIMAGFLSRRLKR